MSHLIQHRASARLLGALLLVLLLSTAHHAVGAKHAAAAQKRIVALGDSLTAGFGLSEEYAYPSLLNERLRADGYPYEVVNAGVSGDTSAGGLARLNWVLQQPTDILIVALGGNDGLRGLSPEAMERNLAQIIQRAQAQGIRVLLVGLQMPTNYGASYRRAFEQVYRTLAKRFDVQLVPNMLQGVGMISRLNQADGIHPNVAGTRIVAETLWEALVPMLRD